MGQIPSAVSFLREMEGQHVTCHYDTVKEARDALEQGLWFTPTMVRLFPALDGSWSCRDMTVEEFRRVVERA